MNIEHFYNDQRYECVCFFFSIRTLALCSNWETPLIFSMNKFTLNSKNSWQFENNWKTNEYVVYIQKLNDESSIWNMR